MLGGGVAARRDASREFIFSFKNKGSAEDASKHRCLCLLSHFHKLFATVLLSTIQAEINPEFLPDQQAGFRSGRSVRDQLLIFHILSQKLLEAGKTGVATWIDFKAAFDTIRHSTLMTAMAEAGCSLTGGAPDTGLPLQRVTPSTASRQSQTDVALSLMPDEAHLGTAARFLDPGSSSHHDGGDVIVLMQSTATTSRTVRRDVACQSCRVRFREYQCEACLGHFCETCRYGTCCPECDRVVMCDVCWYEEGCMACAYWTWRPVEPHLATP